MSNVLENANEVVAAPQVKNISVKEVLSLLEQGKSRKEIADHYGETLAAMKMKVWSHPKLKGRKALKVHGASIVLQDDTEEEVVVQETMTTSAVEEDSAQSVLSGEAEVLTNDTPSSNRGQW